MRQLHFLRRSLSPLRSRPLRLPRGAEVFVQAGDVIAVVEAMKMETTVTAPRSGRLTHLHDRFRDHTNYLFVKHGMTLIGYWTPVEQKDTLVYILAFPSREARETSFDAFRNDPAWQAAFAESHKKAGGKIV